MFPALYMSTYFSDIENHDCPGKNYNKVSYCTYFNRAYYIIRE